MWEYIIRGKLEGLKELYEVVAIVDVRCGCYYKMLHEVIDIVCGWLLIECQRNDGRQRKGKYILERSWKREIHGGFGGGGGVVGGGRVCMFWGTYRKVENNF